jgi:hypothetical protein
MEGIKEMKKTLQECKEIVAREDGWDNLNELTLSTYTEYHTDLANKMYYEQSEWIRVEDALPEHDKWVILHTKDGANHIAYFDKESHNWYSNSKFVDTPTHWRLEPSPPKQ